MRDKKMYFSWTNEIVFVKKRVGRTWLNVSFWYAGVVLILVLLGSTPGTQGACSCNSSVPPCESPVTSIGNSSCTKVGRPDCPCCQVCAAQLGEPCNQSQPCDSSHSLVCKENSCIKGKQKSSWSFYSISVFQNARQLLRYVRRHLNCIHTIESVF
jgi:hypothetical protein